MIHKSDPAYWGPHRLELYIACPNAPTTNARIHSLDISILLGLCMNGHRYRAFIRSYVRRGPDAEKAPISSFEEQ
ncbi:hypothetical protein AG1IA_07257 [Rhizoctonia solani AG-1 IA]|uniref:Uncharacterized protein n=1 Tax=Thanatephorus cucumeris (strain AG1-IA) TaxID=983506 RepID=L8WPL1_THACA|nr:hypothetical protein AG1IA_07257 [Rhizoctonia solani AG-1 IA]